MKELIKKNKDVLLFILSAVVISFMGIDVNFQGTFIQKLKGNSVNYVVYVIFYFIALKKVVEIKDKRMSIVSCIVAIILAVLQVVGFQVASGNAIISKTIVVKILGYFGIFYSLVMLLFNFLNQIRNKEIKLDVKKISNRKFFVFSFIFIFICYVPYFLRYFPGITSMDSTYQIYQSLGRMNLINSHPIFHTLCISIVMNLGKLFGSYNIGVALYSVIQMLFMSLVNAVCLLYMRKKNVPSLLVGISLIFFAIHPMFGMYSITMWKDIPFSIAITLYTISMCELATGLDDFVKSKKSMFFLILSALLTMFFKHNGFYIVLLSIPFVIFYCRKYWKRLLAVYVILVIFYKIINGPVLTALNVAPTLSSEALSIPIQQLSRVVAYGEISDDEFNEINEWIIADRDVIQEEYNPRLSDPMKKYFNNTRFNEDKVGFIKVWLKYLKEYPSVYVASFFANTYGYWYPETQYWMFQRSVGGNEIGMYSDGIINVNLLDTVVEERNIPGISMITSLGFAFWTVGVVMFYFIYRKEYARIMVCIPVMVLWLTSIASSVFCEFRYMFGFFTTMPVILAMSCYKKEDNKKEIGDTEE